MSKYDVIAYVDGSADHRGYGGASAVLISPRTGKRREVTEGVLEGATNQRMEILAAILAFKYLRRDGLEVVIYSDSAYVVNCMQQRWIDNWRRKGWRTSGNKTVANRELWETLESLVEIHEVEFRKVKGHSGVEENERADMLANARRYQATMDGMRRDADRAARAYAKGTTYLGHQREATPDGKRVAQRRRGRRSRRRR